MAVTTMNLMKMSGTELDELFQNSPAGDIPDGSGRGTARVLPGTMFGRFVAGLIRLIAWKGKVVRRERQDLLNLISPFGIRGIRAAVYVEESWFSRGPAIILDYSRTSFVARMIRDEIRTISPGLYLGQVYWGKRRVLRFLLEF
jgi:hypothetical protein